MSAELKQIVAARLRQAGPMTLAEFMQTCLEHPQYGYYMTRDPLGIAGDFITAPEISQVFGELVGAWLGELWDQLGRPVRVHVVDLGPGRGTLLADAMRALQRPLPGFAAAAQLHLVETSPVLKGKQQERLGQLGPTWHSGLETLPDDAPLLVVANEFFDALPIHQLERLPEGGWGERLVDVADEASGADALRFVVGRRAGSAAGLLPGIAETAQPGDLLEIPAAGVNQMRALAERLAAQDGAGLAIDYGHAASRLGATLQAVAGHGPVDPLESPGAADLTAHVDFAQLAAAAREAGCAAQGPIAQGDWLLALGLQERGNALIASAGSRDRARAIYDGCRRLVEAEQMGTLFKALGVAPPGRRLPGFADAF